jgi:hypothetical protein
MSKNTQKKYRKCPQCSNVYPEKDIQTISQRIYEQFSEETPVYCLRCNCVLGEVLEGNFRESQITDILSRNLGDKTIEEIAQKMFENRRMDKRK